MIVPSNAFRFGTQRPHTKLTLPLSVCVSNHHHHHHLSLSPILNRLVGVDKQHLTMSSNPIKTETSEDQLDAILDAAIDDLDSDDDDDDSHDDDNNDSNQNDNRKPAAVRESTVVTMTKNKEDVVSPTPVTKSTKPVTVTPPQPQGKDDMPKVPDEMEALNEVLHDFLQGKEGEEALTEMMQQLQSRFGGPEAVSTPQLSPRANTGQGKSAGAGEKSSNEKDDKETTPSRSNVNRTVDKLLDDMASVCSETEVGDDPFPFGDDQAMMDDLMKEYRGRREHD